MNETLEELQQKLQDVEATIDQHRKRLTLKRKELLKIEDCLFEAKEAALKIVYEIQNFRLTKDIESLSDPQRTKEIEDFKQKVPLLLIRLQKEDLERVK